MSKTTFAIKTDSSGREYVYQQIDEYDKNNRDAATSDAKRSKAQSQFFVQFVLWKPFEGGIFAKETAETINATSNASFCRFRGLFVK
jgi:hypothetical protein